jgi:hypothetical protein
LTDFVSHSAAGTLEWRGYDAITWPKEHSGGPGEASDVLVALSGHFHREGPLRASAEQDLVAAFLSDVRAEYRGGRRMRRKARPMVLLDNIDAHPAGGRLLDLMLDSYATAASAPLIVIAAGGSGTADPYRAHATHTTSRYPLQVRTWRRAGRGEPSAGLIVVEMSRLEDKDVSTMLVDADPPHLDLLVHRLTGEGLPVAVGVITDAVENAGRRVEDIRSLLDLPCRGGGHVGARIVRHLVPDAWHSRLVTLAAAHDYDAACVLLQQAAVFDTSEFLKAQGWATDPRFFVGDRFLRLLLLRELHGRKAEWTKVHRSLHDHYERGSTGRLDEREYHRLYHGLALGDVDAIVHRLADGIGETASLLAALCAVSRMPYFDRHDPRADAACGGDPPATDEPTVHLLHRILNAMWYLTDPFVAPVTSGDVIDAFEGDLNSLANLPGVDDRRLVLAAARTWPRQVRSWQQDLRPPIRGE